MRVDGSSDEAFAESMTAFKDALSSEREYVFGEALNDIWNEGEKAAEAEQREYTADHFYRQLDGLDYEQIVTYTDPTGDTAQTRYRIARKFFSHFHPPPAAQTGRLSRSDISGLLQGQFQSDYPRGPPDAPDVIGPSPH